MKDLYQACSLSVKKRFSYSHCFLDQSHYPLILHCTSGKDRTGFLSALIQLTAGVPLAVFLSEYTRANGRNDLFD
ncbi:tyrosine-protein phosphatase [Bacillus zhangzhouensis]|nr:tyrosine-protein phosphatase [Bacillus zhangzhouensis]